MASLRRPAAQVVRMPWAAAPARSYAQVSRTRVNRAMNASQKIGERNATKEQTMSEMQKAAAMEVFRDGGGPLFPGTFVPIPFAERSKNPVDLFQYQFWRSKSMLQGLLSVLTTKLRSMPGWTKRPLWKAHRAKIAPTAKAMYREMMEAFAAGDKATVSRLCLPRFAKQLHAAMDRRHPSEVVRFEYVKDSRRLIYPRIVSHFIHTVNPYDKTKLSEQAVVAVSSQQQMWRHKKAPKGTVVDEKDMIPGSLRVQDKIEYVVLARATDTATYESGPWRIWGTAAGTTAKAYRQEQAAIEKESLHRAGWKSKEQMEAAKKQGGR